MFPLVVVVVLDVVVASGVHRVDYTGATRNYLAKKQRLRQAGARANERAFFSLILWGDGEGVLFCTLEYITVPS